MSTFLNGQCPRSRVWTAEVNAYNIHRGWIFRGTRLRVIIYYAIFTRRKTKCARQAWQSQGSQTDDEGYLFIFYSFQYLIPLPRLLTKTFGVRLGYYIRLGQSLYTSILILYKYTYSAGLRLFGLLISIGPQVSVHSIKPIIEITYFEIIMKFS